MKNLINVLLLAALSLSFAIHAGGDRPESPHNDDLGPGYGYYVYKYHAHEGHYHACEALYDERDDSSQHSSTSWVTTEDDTTSQDSSIPSWFFDNNHNKDDDFDDNQDAWVDQYLNEFLEKEHFREVHYTPAFYAALDKVIDTKMQHFNHLQSLCNHHPSLDPDDYDQAKEDRARIRSQKLSHKERDRRKASKKFHPDGVTTQARIAKILWAASSHPSAQVHDHKHESHGKRAYAHYLKDFSQQNLQQPDTQYKVPTSNQHTGHVPYTGDDDAVTREIGVMVKALILPLHAQLAAHNDRQLTLLLHDLQAKKQWPSAHQIVKAVDQHLRTERNTDYGHRSAQHFVFKADANQE